MLQEKAGRLDHQQFKSCLRALGYDLPMVEEGQPEPEFQHILDIVDPNRWANYCKSNGTNLIIYSDGYVTLQEYMAFMISKETDNIQTLEEIEKAFRALSKEFRPYVTAEELYAVSWMGLKARIWLVDKSKLTNQTRWWWRRILPKYANYFRICHPNKPSTVSSEWSRTRKLWADDRCPGHSTTNNSSIVCFSDDLGFFLRDIS